MAGGADPIAMTANKRGAQVMVRTERDSEG